MSALLFLAVSIVLRPLFDEVEADLIELELFV